MRKNQAEKIARAGISWRDAKNVLEKAMASCDGWAEVSTINKSLTKGTAFNIFLAPLKGMDEKQLDGQVPYLAAKNILREFGEYSYDDEPIPRRQLAEVEVHHQDPEDWPF